MYGRKQQQELLAKGQAALAALYAFEAELKRTRWQGGVHETAELLGISHTTMLRWEQGGLSRKLAAVVEHIRPGLEDPRSAEMDIDVSYDF